MKNNSIDQSKMSNKNEMDKPQSESRMRAQNRDIINEGKNLAKNLASQNKNQSSSNNSK
jgi:hypothetical protein